MIAQALHKDCLACNTAKPLTEFSPNKHVKDGHCSVCKTCRAAYMRGYYATHKAPWAQRMSAYKKTHRRELNQKEAERRRLRALDPILGEQDRLKHNATQARYVANNHEKTLESSAKYHANNPDKINARRHQRYIENPAKPLANNKKRKARIRGATRNDLTAAQWQAIKDHYGHRCVYCGRKMQRLTQDHLTPLSKGGAHTLSNVVPACQSCNSKKRTGPVLKAVQPLLLL